MSYRRRSSRSHGLTREHRAALVAFEQSKKDAPPKTGAPVEIEVACTCDFRPYPHYLSNFDAATRKRHAEGKQR